MREAQEKEDPYLVLSSSDSEDDEAIDPEMKLIIRFEERLKKRIFIADRFEKVEKALVTMTLIPKDTLFCSDFELNRFKEILAGPGALEKLSELISEDSEEVWFDLYRTITT